MKLYPFLWAAVGTLFSAQMAAAQPATASTQTIGERVYQNVCIACHETGVAHAPKFQDRTAWEPLIAEGQHILTGHAWVGVRAMPARGGSNDLSLEDFARAVAYMARNAGADWADPDPVMMKRIIREAEKRLIQTIKEQKAMQRELHRLAR